MSNLCIQVEDYVSPFAGRLPSVQTEDLIYIEKYEEDSYGHWVFEKNSASLIDRVNSRSLTLQAGATVQPEYATNYLQLGAAMGNSLQSGLFDNTVTGFTMSALVQPEDTSLMILFGCLGGLDFPTGGGGFTSVSKVYLTIRTGVSSLDSGLALDMTKPVFISFSINKTTGTSNLVAMQNGIVVEKTRNGVYVASAAALSVGNSRYTTSASYAPLRNKFYEAIIHDRALSLSEMKAVASRAKTRQANRGIAF